MTPLEKIQSMKMPFAELKGVTFTEAGMDRVVAQDAGAADLCTLRQHDSPAWRFSEDCRREIPRGH